MRYSASHIPDERVLPIPEVDELWQLFGIVEVSEAARMWPKYGDDRQEMVEGTVYAAVDRLPEGSAEPLLASEADRESARGVSDGT